MQKLYDDFVGYGDYQLHAYRSIHDEHYFPQRVPIRYWLSMGLVRKDVREGIRPKDNGIWQPCLLKSIHAPSWNSTNDGGVWELFKDKGTVTDQRLALQYLPQNLMPMTMPEFIIFPENIMYFKPGQDSYVFYCLEPVGVLGTGSRLFDASYEPTEPSSVVEPTQSTVEPSTDPLTQPSTDSPTFDFIG